MKLHVIKRRDNVRGHPGPLHVVRLEFEPLDWLAMAPTIAGAVNWGLVGALGLDAVALVSPGSKNWPATLVCIGIGLAALQCLRMLLKVRRAMRLAARPPLRRL